MNKLFLPYNLALLAKEKGFDEPCFAIFDNEGFRLTTEPLRNSQVEGHWRFTYPLYQQIIDWFREKHEIYIIPFIQYEPAFDEKETIINSYMILNVPIMREKELSYLPYVQSNDYMENATVDTWYGSLTEAIEEAFKLIQI